MELLELFALRLHLAVCHSREATRPATIAKNEQNTFPGHQTCCGLGAFRRCSSVQQQSPLSSSTSRRSDCRSLSCSSCCLRRGLWRSLRKPEGTRADTDRKYHAILSSAETRLSRYRYKTEDQISATLSILSRGPGFLGVTPSPAARRVTQLLSAGMKMSLARTPPSLCYESL